MSRAIVISLISSLISFIFGVVFGAAFLAGRLGASKVEPTHTAESLSPKFVGIDPSFFSPSPEMVRRAVTGDAEASATLLDTYNKACDRFADKEKVFLKCSREGWQWAIIDAENGSKLGMSDAINELSDSKYCLDLYRSIFWINIARKRDVDSYRETEKFVTAKLENCRW